jgi:hypothetical protein
MRPGRDRVCLAEAFEPAADESGLDSKREGRHQRDRSGKGRACGAGVWSNYCKHGGYGQARDDSEQLPRARASLSARSRLM